jgi:hypothetical protein
MLTQEAIKRQLPKRKPFNVPVILEIHFHSKLDADNHGFIAKMIVDGCKQLLLHDDTQKYVKGVCMLIMEEDVYQHTKKDIVVTVREI